jgi:hypothetical protein
MSAKKQRTFKLRAKDFEVRRAIVVADGRNDGRLRIDRTRVVGRAVS